MHNRLNESINIAIMENELSASDWELNQLAWTLYWFVDFFNVVFFKDQPVPIPVLTFEKTRVNSLGNYRVGLNDFAVKGQINLNRLYINSPLSELLQTLIHEMVHSWEFLYVDEKKNNSLKKIFNRIGGQRILVVTDSAQNPDFIMINLLGMSLAGNKPFELNKLNIDNAGLEVDPKILFIGGSEDDLWSAEGIA